MATQYVEKLLEEARKKRELLSAQTQEINKTIRELTGLLNKDNDNET